MKTLIATLMIAAPLVAISHSAVAETAPRPRLPPPRRLPLPRRPPPRRLPLP
jgi:hypothetical protein